LRWEPYSGSALEDLEQQQRMKEVSLSLREVLRHDLLDGLRKSYYMECVVLWSQIGLRMTAVLEIEEVDVVENMIQVRLGVANSGWMVDVRMH
jgi:hypothetical protein